MTKASAKIVICGAGIAGIAAAYQLAVVHGVEGVTLVEAGNPLSLTSDKSTEAYRNWWPGPDWAMTAFMDRSIDLMEEIARATGNRINLNRRGYLFATADATKIAFLSEMAQIAESRGAGAARFHDTPSSGYAPSPERGFDCALTGADVITDRSLIRRHFPYLAPETVAVAHARRAGWLSAQQLGSVMLEAARERGVKLLRGRIVGIDVSDRVRGVAGRAGWRAPLAGGDASRARRRADAAGDGAMTGVDLPIFAERHHKVSFADTAGVPRAAPMMIWLDAQYLPWSDDERAALEADDEARWLLRNFPPACTAARTARTSTLLLFNHHGDVVEPEFPLPEPPTHYGEIALRGMSTMVPGLQVLRRQAVPSLRRRRLLREDAREPPADRPGAGRGPLSLVRLFGLRRDGLLRRRRIDRAAYHGRAAAGLCAGLPALALSGS